MSAYLVAIFAMSFAALSAVSLIKAVGHLLNQPDGHSAN